MELLQLKYFYESAQSGSFSKTAQKHMVPLSSVSAAIRRLEKELNCELFDRFPNYIALNENGKKLQKSLCIAFGEIDSAVNEITAADDFNWEIRVLVRGLRRKVSERIVQFNKIFPRCIFKISFSFTETDFENYDIIIDEENPRYNGYQKIKFFSEKLKMKCDQDHPLLGQEILMRQLVNSTFLSMGEESNLHRILLKACAKAGFSPKIHVLCNDLECYEKLIAGGLGIAIGIENNQTPGIAYLNVSDFDERYTLYCYFKESSYTGATQKFIDFLSHNLRLSRRL